VDKRCPCDRPWFFGHTHRVCRIRIEQAKQKERDAHKARKEKVERERRLR